MKLYELITKLAVLDPNIDVKIHDEDLEEAKFVNFTGRPYVNLTNADLDERIKCDL